MIKSLKQTGFSVIEIVLVLAVLGVIGFIGYTVWQAQQNKTTQQATPTDTQQALTWQKGDIAVSGKYADADVVKVDDTTWRMYYAVQPEVQGNNFEVYSATSADGTNWTPEAGVRKTGATFPEVVKLSDGRWRMYFQQAGVIKSAISSDGLSFSDEAGTRIDTANSEGLTFDNVAAPSILLLDDGSYMLVYRGTINERYAANTPNATTQLFMWATSTDGLSFTKKGIAVDSRNDMLSGQLDGADLVKWDDDQLHLFATSYTGIYEFTWDGTKFSEGALAFAGEAKPQTGQGFSGAPPGDPTTAKINDTWYMYYGATGEESGIHYATLK